MDIFAILNVMVFIAFSFCVFVAYWTGQQQGQENRRRKNKYVTPNRPNAKRRPRRK
jgi:hypothetical protein